MAGIAVAGTLVADVIKMISYYPDKGMLAVATSRNSCFESMPSDASRGNSAAHSNNARSCPEERFRGAWPLARQNAQYSSRALCSQARYRSRERRRMPSATAGTDAPIPASVSEESANAVVPVGVKSEASIVSPSLVRTAYQSRTPSNVDFVQ